MSATARGAIGKGERSSLRGETTPRPQGRPKGAIAPSVGGERSSLRGGTQ